MQPSRKRARLHRSDWTSKALILEVPFSEKLGRGFPGRDDHDFGESFLLHNKMEPRGYWTRGNHPRPEGTSDERPIFDRDGGNLVNPFLRVTL